MKNEGGLTVIELIVVMGIMAILSMMLWTGYQSTMHRFESVPCMGNLRNLHAALSARLIDQQSWPQLPEEIEMNTLAEHDFWIEELELYGMVEKNWICPTLRRTARKEGRNLQEESKIHYVPTLFDEHPGTPFRWPNIPWAMEIGNNHGRGLLVLLHDGSIHPSSEIQKGAFSKPLPTSID